MHLATQNAVQPAYVALAAAANLLAYQNAKKYSTKVPRDGRITKWKLPTPGMFKLNVDYACNESCGIHGLGIVIRNY